MTIANLRQSLRQRFLNAGYRIDCVQSIPCQLLDENLVRRLEFEDVVCRRMVETGRPLTFVQVGAFDGVTKDPLFPYIRDHGWKGVLVEPQRRPYEALLDLHREREGIRVVNAAIAEREGTVTLYGVEGEGLPGWCGGLASMDRDSIAKHESLVPGLGFRIVEERVQTLPFSKLLADSGPGEIDLLQVDTEGSDAMILGLFPFESVKPAIVHFEIKHLGKRELEECLERFAGFGYRFAPSGGEDLLAVL